MWPLLLAEVLASHPHPCIHRHFRGTRPADAIDSIVSETHPLRVHIARTQDRALAEEVLAHAEEAWDFQVGFLGFRPPVEDTLDGPEVDIYLTDTGDPWYAWADADTYTDTVSGDGYNSATAYIVFPQDIPSSWARSYAVHEFNHILQWATDFTEPTYPIWEAVATAVQAYPEVENPQWGSEFRDFQTHPWAPSLVGDAYTLSEPDLGLFEYGAALWVLHLDQVLGAGDGRALADLWEAAANEGMSNEPDVIDAIETVSGSDIGTFLNGLALTRWLVADDWDERGLPVAAGWRVGRKVPAISAALPAVDATETVTFDPPPMVTGQAFVEIPVEGETGTLFVTAQSDRGLETALAGFTFGEDRTEHGDVGVSPTLSIPLAGADSVMVALSNLGRVGWDGDDNAWVRGDQVLTLQYVAEVQDPTVEAPEAPKGCGCESNKRDVPVLGWLPRR